MGKSYYLNYGGPGGLWGSENPEDIEFLDNECRKHYGMPIRKVRYMIQGINVTICTYGIHRALRLDIPDNASKETVNMFEDLKDLAEEIIEDDYELLNNNCVTSVARVLNYLVPNILPKKLIWPWSLDKNIKKNCKNYLPNTDTSNFINKYTEISDRHFFSFSKGYDWDDNQPSNRDIIKNAYGKRKERTKSALIELGWVTEDTNHILHPTDASPLEFKRDLAEFNLDHEKVVMLKNLYKSEAGFFSRNVRNFFKDNPNYETALKRVIAQARKNPQGAAFKVLKSLQFDNADLDKVPDDTLDDNKKLKF